MAEWRTNLHTPECQTPASAVVRNAGSNPNVFTSNAPILGSTLTMSVATGAYNFATIVVYQNPANVTLGGGQVVLVDGASSLLTQFGPLTGSNPEVEVALPVDMTLCNFSFTAQTILFGGTTPFALTNAVDMVSGGL